MECGLFPVTVFGWYEVIGFEGVLYVCVFGVPPEAEVSSVIACPVSFLPLVCSYSHY